MRTLPLRSRFLLSSAALVAFAACGGRSPLETNEFGLPGDTGGTAGASVGTGGTTVGKGGTGTLGTGPVGSGGATVGKGGSTVGTGPVGTGGGTVGTGGGTVGTGGGTVGTGGGTVGTGGATVGTGGAPLGTGGAPVGPGGAPVGTGGVGGSVMGCFQGSFCQAGSACLVMGPPGCQTQCKCDGTNQYQCATSCGTGGGPQQCLPGAKCSPGTGCTGPVPGQPNCQFQCNCDPSGTFQCGEGCSGPGGTGGAPTTCVDCLSNVSSQGVCPVENNQCGNDAACVDLANCAVNNGCLEQFNPIQCAAQAGCKLQPQAIQDFVQLLDCLECSGCQGVCPTNPNQCSTGPVGPGPGPVGPGPLGTGGGPQGCSSCIAGVIQTDGCPAQLNACDATPGCTMLAQCYQNSGCLDAFDVLACGAQACPAPFEPVAALSNFLQCAECGPCAPQCSGAGVCNAGAGGSSTGPGTMGFGGSGPPPDCNQCVQQAQMQGQCQQQLQACFSNPACQQLINCQNNCSDQTCIDQCSQKFPAGVPGYDAIIFCLGCQACGAECQSQLPPGFCLGG